MVMAVARGHVSGVENWVRPFLATTCFSLARSGKPPPFVTLGHERTPPGVSGFGTHRFHWPFLLQLSPLWGMLSRPEFIWPSLPNFAGPNGIALMSPAPARY